MRLQQQQLQQLLQHEHKQRIRQGGGPMAVMESLARLEAETFEIAEIDEVNDNFAAFSCTSTSSCSCSSTTTCSSSTSSCCSCSSSSCASTSS